MEETENKKKKENAELKIGFFRRVRISVIDFENYHVIAAEGWKKAILYMLKLVLIFSIIVSSLTCYKLSMTISAMCLYARNNLPEFKVENNQFSIESTEPIIIENKDTAKTKIVFDNNDEPEKYTDGLDSQENLVVITKNQVYLKLNVGATMSYSIEDLCRYFGITSFTKSEIVTALESYATNYALFIYIFIAFFIIYFVSILLDILALAVVGYLLSRIIGLPLKFSAVFAIATSSITLPIILNLIYIIVNMFSGFTMKYFQIMYTLISYIYLIASLVLMRSNLIKIKTKKSKIMNDKENQQGASEE